MATYGQNTTIKVNAAVSASGSNTTLYTAPANGYAILNAYLPAAGNITVAGQIVNAVGGNSIAIYVGPGQAVACVSSASISGVEFINTP